jgi:hypothetical protein
VAFLIEPVQKGVNRPGIGINRDWAYFTSEHVFNRGIEDLLVQGFWHRIGKHALERPLPRLPGSSFSALPSAFGVASRSDECFVEFSHG